MDFKTFRSWSGHNLDRCRILIRVVLTNFRQVLGLKVFLDLFGGLLVTFPGSCKKPLFISRQLDFRCLGTGERSRETVGDGDSCAPSCVVDTMAEKQISRATAVFIAFTPDSSLLVNLFSTLK